MLPSNFITFPLSSHSQTLLDGCFTHSLSSNFQHAFPYPLFSAADLASYFTDKTEAFRREELQTPTIVSINLLVSVSTYPAFLLSCHYEGTVCTSTEDSSTCVLDSVPFGLIKVITLVIFFFLCDISNFSLTKPPSPMLRKTKTVLVTSVTVAFLSPQSKNSTKSCFTFLAQISLFPLPLEPCPIRLLPPSPHQNDSCQGQ